MIAIQALQRITRARSILVQEEPFFGCLALYLKVEARPDLTDTMATDGTRLIFNPETVMEWTEPELVGVIAHEVYHCALAHHARIGDRDLSRFNEAADYAIHTTAFLKRFRMPKGILVDPAFDNLGAEEIYSMLERKPQDKKPDAGAPDPGKPDAGQNGAGAPQQAASGASKPGKGQGVGGVMRPADNSEAGRAAEIDKWSIRARQAAAVAKAQNAGTMPEFAERIIAEIKAAKVDWHAVLAEFITSRVSTDYSFSRPNRRFLHTGFALPGAVADAVNHLVIAFDSSGSMNDRMVQAGASEAVAAMEGGKIARLTVIFADTIVQAVQEFEIGDDIRLQPKGGGGTRFDATFRYIAEHCDDAAAVIYFTDLKCNHWGVEPDCPVLWAVHGDSRQYAALAAKAPFGEPVYVGRLE